MDRLPEMRMLLLGLRSRPAYPHRAPGRNGGGFCARAALTAFGGLFRGGRLPPGPGGRVLRRLTRGCAGVSGTSNRSSCTVAALAGRNLALGFDTRRLVTCPAAPVCRLSRNRSASSITVSRARSDAARVTCRPPPGRSVALAALPRAPSARRGCATSRPCQGHRRRRSRQQPCARRLLAGGPRRASRHHVGDARHGRLPPLRAWSARGAATLTVTASRRRAGTATAARSRRTTIGGVAVHDCRKSVGASGGGAAAASAVHEHGVAPGLAGRLRGAPGPSTCARPTCARRTPWPAYRRYRLDETTLPSRRSPSTLQVAGGRHDERTQGRTLRRGSAARARGRDCLRAECSCLSDDEVLNYSTTSLRPARLILGRNGCHARCPYGAAMQSGPPLSRRGSLLAGKVPWDDSYN